MEATAVFLHLVFDNASGNNTGDKSRLSLRESFLRLLFTFLPSLLFRRVLSLLLFLWTNLRS